MQIGNVLGGIAVYFLAVVIIMAGIAWGVAKFTSRTIESATRIEPELKLTIKGNKVDTVYIYRRP